MSPTTEELDAGRKAYQRLKLLGRYYPGSLFGSHQLFVITMFSGAMVALGFVFEMVHDGDYGKGALMAIGLVFALCLWLRQRAQCRKDFAFLRQLKFNYGEGIYSELKREPSSFYYAVFQKLHGPDSRRVPVNLP